MMQMVDCLIGETGKLTDTNWGADRGNVSIPAKEDIYSRGGMVIVKHLIRHLTGISLHLIQTVNMLCYGIVMASHAVVY